MIKKFDLIEGAYYMGVCRNTNIAKWHEGMFIFINLQFNRPYLETINYYGDVKNINTDGFIPTKLITINVDNILKAKNDHDYKNYARKIYLNLNNCNLNGEIWKDIFGYEGLYMVSNLGRVKILKGNRIMKQNFSREYLILGLTDNNKKRKTFRVHRLVATTFKNKIGVNLEVNHINGIKSDNRHTNLEWVSHSNNLRHSYTSGNVKKKLTPEMVLEIKKLLNDGCVQKNIAHKYNISYSTVSEINTGKKWINI